MSIPRLLAIAAAAASVRAVLTGCFNEPPTAKEEIKPVYILPAEITIDVSAHRESGGGITLIGCGPMTAYASYAAFVSSVIGIPNRRLKPDGWK